MRLVWGQALKRERQKLDSEDAAPAQEVCTYAWSQCGVFGALRNEMCACACVPGKTAGASEASQFSCCSESTPNPCFRCSCMSFVLFLLRHVVAACECLLLYPAGTPGSRSSLPEAQACGGVGGQGQQESSLCEGQCEVRPHVNKPGERLLAVGCWRENQDNHHVRCAKLECKILLVKITVT